MKNGLKVAIIIGSALIAFFGGCMAAVLYFKHCLKEFEFDDDILFEEENEVYPEILEE